MHLYTKFKQNQFAAELLRFCHLNMFTLVTVCNLVCDWKWIVAGIISEPAYKIQHSRAVHG